MKRQPDIPNADGPTETNGAKTYAPDELKVLTAYLRGFLDEVDGRADAMKARGIEQVTLPVGGGAKSYAQACKFLRSWSRGVGEAILDLHRPPDAE